MNFRRRLRVRHLQNKCSVCKATACRFLDVPGQLRKWFCAACFEQQEKSNG